MLCNFPPFLFAISLGKNVCASCGAGLKSSSKFFPFCGQKVANDTSTSETDKGATKCLSLQKYAAKKSEERSTHFRSSGSKRRGQKKREEDPFALINIGVMRFVGPDVTAPIRGKTLPLKVRKDCGYAEVFIEALVKRQAHDQAFVSRTSWKLVYPDGQLAMNLPDQQEEEFTLRDYEEDLGKPYNRITLYLCPEEPEDEFMLDSETETEPDTQGVRKKIRSEECRTTPDHQLPFQQSTGSASSVSVPHTYAHSVTCDDGPRSTSDADLLYASLIPGTLLYSSDSEGENVPVAVDDPQVFQIKTSWSLQEILEQLALKINEDKISKFNISRSHLWEGALRGLRRKSFSPDNKVSVKFTDDSGTSEGAIDLGGPKREFFTLVLDWIVNSQLFCGPEKSKFLSCNANYLGNDYFFYAGEFIAMSIVHGGPGPRCFGLPLYDALTKGVTQANVCLENVYDFDLRNSLQAIKNTTSVQEAQKLISDHNLETV
ncbi:uncharacterized protein [Montipora foliosa]|uniref:uncharacterized protein n=1 Tax=Montipora foliosa TaxID=591990 RepID=UPI0035F1CCCE